ncbi:dihydrofolate reductase family protein [Pseudemcibacter aquimaris]|uniref:dihydrofolate reductase family protein n=1 Tax=Pseudemcibacter aquimaris TaxID=2857064 RepID=UPI00201190E2|nr:dihydrofolate reductase family protein [Pseudemcibacter aquimaris]MCC3859851.1 dihydrofolate reductase family protein [Pseudemcibacter aquimaris]WDU57183.1 dihydrofolate reductase family protein [Pseudemcibacter aquimaris]
MTNFVYLGCSLDGFIARKDGAVDFLDAVDPAPDDEDYGWEDYIGGIDGLIMGRNSYDMVLGYGQWIYGDRKVMVLTTRDIEIPDFVEGEIIPFEGKPEEAVQCMNEMGCQNLYIDGGKVVQDFINDGQVDELIITMVPIIIGEGIPLFANINVEKRLDLKNVTKYDNGLLTVHYNLKK